MVVSFGLVCHFILDLCRLHSEYLEYHEEIVIPDEIFINSIIYSFLDKEYIENRTLQYVSWNSPIDTKSIITLTMKDKKLINDVFLDARYFFIRKFDCRIDPNIIY